MRHTRDAFSALFLQFTDRSRGRELLRSLRPLMKSALKHLQEVRRFQEPPYEPGTPYVGVGLTAAGYAALGVPQAPDDPSFRAGMQANADLHDPDPAGWDPAFRDPALLHAVVLVADASTEAQAPALDAVLALVNAANGVVLLGRQDGQGLHNAAGEGIEHFGYVDGRSQPLFLQEDIDEEARAQDGIDRWDPAAPLDQVLVADPAAPDPGVHFGSYFVFRKLEQNVQRFKDMERRFASAEWLGIDDPERAGAMLVGRFEDGTPVTLQRAEGMAHPVPNNFSYGGDLQGAKCPVAGHIRKTNPRGSAGREPPEAERLHLMARRGQTYGTRTDDPNDGRIDNKPTREVGLLFMAFNSRIGRQFEFMQVAWANNPDFPVPGAGVDIVIGQTDGGAARPPITCPVKWGDPSRQRTVPALPQTVTMKGGAYFFMPSLAFLAAL